MADIAQIGFAADTSSLSRAEASLERLTPAAAAAETAATKAASGLNAVQAAAAGVSNTNANLVRVISGASNALNVQAANTNKVTDALKKQYDVQKRINDITGVSNRSDTTARSADIIAYGKALDETRAKYDPLFAAGMQYKANLSEINNALKVGALNEAQHKAAIMDTKVAFTQQVNSIRGVTDQEKAFEEQNKKTRASINGISWEAKNLGYQLVDVTQGVLMGQSVFMIFAQQAGQIGQVIATSPQGLGGLLKELGSKFAALVTPTRLAVFGILAVAAAAFFITKSVIDSSKSLDDLGRSIDMQIGKLHGLQQAMQFKGLSKEDIATGMKAFAESVYDAQHNMGGLNGLMISNNMKAKDFQGYLNNVADLVQRTTSDVQKQKLLREAGLPNDMNWVRFMEQGSKGIADAVGNTVKFNESAEKNLVQKAREFDDAWNKATTNISNTMKSWVIDALGWFKGLIDKAGEFTRAMGGIKEPTRLTVGASPTGTETFNKPAGPQPKTQAELLAENSQAQQRLSLLGELATVEQKVTMTRLQLNAATLNGVGVSAEMAKKLQNVTRATAEQNDVTAMATAGVFNNNLARKAASDTLQVWIDRGLVDKNNTEQMAAAQLVLSRNIKATSDAAAVAAAPLQQLKQLQLDASNFSKVLDTGVTGALNNLVSPIQDVMNHVTSLGDGFKNMGIIVLKAIQEMIIKMLIVAPIAKALMSILNPFASVGSGVADTMQIGSQFFPKFNAKGNVYANDNIAHFAKGNAFTNSIVSKPTLFSFANGAKLGQMGEAGSEAIMPLKRGPNGSLGVQMYGQSTNDNSSMNVTYAPQYNVAQGADPQAIAELRKAQASDRAEFASRVARIIPELRKRGAQV